MLGAIVVSSETPTAQARDCSTLATQTDMNQCADRQVKFADAALNAAYRQIVDRLAGAGETRPLLVAAQRSWIKFRDTECAFSASGVLGGSIYPMITSTCLTGLTQARSHDLRRYLACEEGDLSCPVPHG